MLSSISPEASHPCRDFVESAGLTNHFPCSNASSRPRSCCLAAHGAAHEGISNGRNWYLDVRLETAHLALVINGRKRRSRERSHPNLSLRWRTKTNRKRQARSTLIRLELVAFRRIPVCVFVNLSYRLKCYCFPLNFNGSIH